MRAIAVRALLIALVVSLSGCATLGQAISAPRIESASGYTPEMRLLPPSADSPLGGVALRLWARVENPNPLSITLAALNGDLELEGIRAAQVDFPLGVPLPASADTIIPLDLRVGLADVPGLARVVTRALTGEMIDYELIGRISVDAGILGQPSFGPMRLLQGSVRPIR